MKRMQTSEKNDYFDFKDTCKLNRRIFLPQLEMVRLAWYLNVFSMSFLFAFFMVTNCTHKFCDYIWHKVLESFWYISFFFFINLTKLTMLGLQLSHVIMKISANKKLTPELCFLRGSVQHNTTVIFTHYLLVSKIKILTHLGLNLSQPSFAGKVVIFVLLTQWRTK